MNRKQEQKISVKPDTLANLIIDVANGNYRIPQFQREFVWKKSKIIELFDSIYREYPIGSFFLWQAGREHNNLFRHTVDLGLPAVGEHDSVSFILDGQQRITSLYVSLNGMTVNGVDYSKIAFDMKEEKFTDRKADNARYVAVYDMWGPDSMALSRRIDEQYVAAYDRCWKTLQTYPISIVEVRDKDLPAVCRIFQRINQSGKRLDRFDLIAAMTFTTEFDLREKFKDDVLELLKARNFGAISPVVLTQLLALIKSGQCTERHEFALTTADIQERWNNAVSSVMLAADTLRRCMGVINAGFLPYDALLTLLAYYFAKSGSRSLPQKHMDWVQRWFWRAAFGKRYGSGGPTRIGQDRELFDGLINGGAPLITFPVTLNETELIKVRMTQTGSAVRNAFLCLLAIRGPKHLINNSELDLINGSISDFTSSEKHHIFPQAYLDREGPAGADVHALPNFCFLPSELNKRILDAQPSKYFKELAADNSRFEESVRSHLLSTDGASGVQDDDYFKFLKVRAGIVLEEVRRLCGDLTTPREDERQRAIEDLEHRIRDCIDRILLDHAGPRYWKSHIPQAVRENADKRIESEIARSPELTPATFQDTRRRLDYCNVMDYATVIENGGNWSAFAGVFRKKDDLRRYLSGFSEYRNAVMHSREMTELVEKNGEAALIWFANVLPDEDQSVDVPENG